MTETAAKILTAINNSKNVLVCGHIRPDGDCIGSAFAMRRICEKLGKNADAVCDAEKVGTYGFLPYYNRFNEPRFDSYDLFIAVDCADKKRLGEYVRHIDAAKNSINIDHHPTNPGYGRINHIDPDASSVCEIIFTLFEDSGLIDEEIAAMLFTGLSTDTGHFMHSNTTPKVFDIAGKLAKTGVDIASITHSIYCNKSINRIKLTARALDSIRTYEDGKLALMTVTLDDLNACGCTSADTEGLIDHVSSISGVVVAISICEQPGNIFRTSLRSATANVAAVAAMFGGGGHRLAAGCIINGNRYDVAERIVKAAATAL